MHCVLTVSHTIEPYSISVIHNVIIVAVTLQSLQPTAISCSTNCLHVNLLYYHHSHANTRGKNNWAKNPPCFPFLLILSLWPGSMGCVWVNECTIIGGIVCFSLDFGCFLQSFSCCHWAVKVWISMSHMLFVFICIDSVKRLLKCDLISVVSVCL